MPQLTFAGAKARAHGADQPVQSPRIRRRVLSTDGRSLRFEREIRPVLFDTTQLALERAIGGAAQRHAALAANLANVNTPGYQRVDVDFHSALQSALESSGDTRAAVERTTFSAERDATAVTRADGNGVDADAESAKLAANALEQQAAVQVAHARIGILKSAMGVA
jgi:flagellar basal-body rod protein FlgB